jgi:hypothetical protein
MRLGFNIPNLGRSAGPESIVKVAQRAEALGYDTLWVTERLLWPINPQTPYAGSPDGHCRRPTNTAWTRWIAHPMRRRTQPHRPWHQRTDMPYNPVARPQADDPRRPGPRQAAGRLGQGWSRDEFDASGALARTARARATSSSGAARDLEVRPRGVRGQVTFGFRSRSSNRSLSRNASRPSIWQAFSPRPQAYRRLGDG